MKYTLIYAINDVSVTLSVTADSPEQAETMMKRGISKMLRNFPVGYLFGYFTNSIPGLIPLQPATEDFSPLGPGFLMPQTGLLTYGIGGEVTLSESGYTLSNVSPLFPLSPGQMQTWNPVPGTFTLTQTEDEVIAGADISSGGATCSSSSEEKKS